MTSSNDGFIDFLGKNNCSEEKEGYNPEIEAIINTHSLEMTTQRDTNLLG